MLLDLMVEAIGFGVGVRPVVLFGLRVVCVRMVDCLGFLFSLRGFDCCDSLVAVCLGCLNCIV